MLLALVFRGVAFEFRFREPRIRTLLGPRLLRTARRLATFAQGIVLGAFIQGFEVNGRDFAGSSLRLLHAVLAPDRHRAACSATVCSAPAGWC